MAARSPARYLAPIALILTVAAVVIVLASSDSGDSGREQGRTTVTQERPPARRTYVVRQGDTLNAIAERFAMTQERLLALNPDIDVQALQPGTRLKLRP